MAGGQATAQLHVARCSVCASSCHRCNIRKASRMLVSPYMVQRGMKRDAEILDSMYGSLKSLSPIRREDLWRDSCDQWPRKIGGVVGSRSNSLTTSRSLTFCCTLNYWNETTASNYYIT